MDAASTSAPVESLDNLTPSKPLPRRRNGQEQACEPCRKAKVKCDHSLPTCMKCIRRKNPYKCIYLPAPMSQQKTPRSLERSSTSAPPISPQVSFSPRATVPRFLDTIRTPPPAPARIVPKSSTPTRTTGADNASGFLLTTGFPAIVKDNFVESIADPIDVAERPHQSTFAAHNMTSDEVNGIRILRQFPDRRTCEVLMNRYQDTEECSFHTPTVLHIVSSIWSTYGRYLEEPRSLQNLEPVVEDIIYNTSKPLKEPEDYHEWQDTFSGPRLRWEALGIAFICLAFSCVCSRRNTLQEQSISHINKNYSIELKGCAEAIISMLRKHEIINPLVVVLLAKHLHLNTLIHGDTSFQVWREHGDLVGALTALNLHLDDGTSSSSSPETINLAQQIRRRVFSSVFIFDKSLALFNGRPPILSRRYISCPLPLDLPDDAFIHGKEHLLREAEQLDDMGWSLTQDGTIRDLTHVRLEVLFSMMLDEILEMLIGNRAQYSDDRLHNLKCRTDQIYKSIPRHLHFLHADLHAPSALCLTSDKIHWAALSGRLEYLRMTFLMERLATERSSTPQCVSRQKLIDISRDMLENTVYLWLQRDRFHDRLHDYDYMLMCYGMPSAGILCVELLRSIKRNSKEGEEEREKVRLPRSEVVQNLSLLVGFLDWVRPSAGNYKLCGRMRQIIQRILDMVLDPQGSSAVEPANKRQRVEQHRPLQSDGLSKQTHFDGNTPDSLVHQRGTDPQLKIGNPGSDYGASDAQGESRVYTGQTQAQNGFGTGMGFGSSSETVLAESGGTGITKTVDEEFGSFLDEGLENLDWLNSVDWTRGPWIDLN